MLLVTLFFGCTNAKAPTSPTPSVLPAPLRVDTGALTPDTSKPPPPEPDTGKANSDGGSEPEG